MVVVSTVGLGAQGPPGLKTGNPTPGVPQPAPPDLAERITLTGCLQPTRDNRDPTRSATANPNSPSDARFTLGNAQRSGEAPPGTGTGKAPVEAAGKTYRLLGLDSQLLPFIGMQVEISGEVLPSAAGSRAGIQPILQVEFVQKLKAGCP